MHRLGLIVAATLLAGIAIPWLLGGDGTWQRLASVPTWVIPAALGLVFLGWNLNAGRLRLLGSSFGLRLPHWRALGTVMATEFAFVATPAGGGAPVTLIYLLQQRGIKRSDAAALFAVDQITDLVFFLSAVLGIALAVTLAPADSGLAGHLAIMGGLIVAAIAGLFALLHHYRHWLLLGGRLLRGLHVGAERRRRFARGILRFRAAVGLMLRLPRWRLLAVYLLCAGHWMIRYSILYLLLRALGEADITWGYTFVVQMMAFTAGQFTFLPGGSGGVELTFGALLGPSLEGATLAAALIAWRFATFHWYLIAGAPVFALLAGRTLWRQLRGG